VNILTFLDPDQSLHAPQSNRSLLPHLLTSEGSLQRRHSFQSPQCSSDQSSSCFAVSLAVSLARSTSWTLILAASSSRDRRQSQPFFLSLQHHLSIDIKPKCGQNQPEPDPSKSNSTRTRFEIHLQFTCNPDLIAIHFSSLGTDSISPRTTHASPLLDLIPTPEMVSSSSLFF